MGGVSAGAILAVVLLAFEIAADLLLLVAWAVRTSHDLPKDDRPERPGDDFFALGAFCVLLVANLGVILSIETLFGIA